jgi:hypothetical protein
VSSRITTSLLAAAVAAAAITPATAHAYRTYADDPEVRYPARWYSSSVEWELSTAGLEASGLTRQEVETAITEGATIAATPPCEHAVPTAQHVGSTDGLPFPGDGRNTIAFITGWSALGRLPARGATTEVEVAVDSDGTARIVEADIYLNLADYRFSLDGEEGTLDLRSVIGHEWLHLLGFLHVCEVDAAGGAPQCSEDPRFVESALYPEYVGVRARNASGEDLEGVCALYPSSSAPCETACTIDERCVSGVCRRRAPAMCASDVECNVDGTASLRCATHGDATDTCVAAGGLWTSCDSSSDCGSGLCLTSMSAMSRFCTSSCTADSECPPDLVCEVASGSSVCRPAPPSCATSTAEHRPSSLSWLVLFIVAWAVRRRRVGPGLQSGCLARSIEERS